MPAFKRTAFYVILCTVVCLLATPPAWSLQGGQVWTWGDNDFGHLGDGSTANRPTPAPVTAISNVLSVAGGDDHTLAVMVDGSLKSWGRNATGSLGDGTTTMRKTPVSVDDLSGVVAAGAGEEYSAALTGDGSVWTWGSNTFSALGDGCTGTSCPPYRTKPARVVTLSDIVSIAVVQYKGMALRADGTVWSWGDNSKGSLGNGTDVNHTSTPVQASNMDGVVALAAGENFKAVLRLDGSVWAWGERLITGTATNSNIPVRINGIDGVASIAAGPHHMLARKMDGTLWAWGITTAYCALGDAICLNSAVPVPITAISGATALDGGDSFTTTLRWDGTVWSWGWNVMGQLGNGTTTDSKPAVPATGVSGARGIASGTNHVIAIVGGDGCTATLDQNLRIHMPRLNLLGRLYSLDIDYLPSSQGPILFRLVGLAPSAAGNCNPAIFLIDGAGIVIHIPDIALGTASYRLTFEYVPTSDGNIVFSLRDLGQN